QTTTDYFRVSGIAEAAHILSSQLLLFSALLLLIVGKGVFRVSANRFSLEIEGVWNRTAGQGKKGQESTGPLVVHPVVHLLSEQNDTGTPNRPEKSLGCKGRCCLVLVCIHCNNISIEAS